jgi:hypothetical protein
VRITHARGYIHTCVAVTELHGPQKLLLEVGASSELSSRVIDIIQSVGFKDELANPGSTPFSREGAIVQDADR